MRMMMWKTMGLALLLAATPAVAGPVYQWTDADGTVAFSDDLQRIPEAARGSAQAIETRGLGDYGRYTPRAADRPGYMERLYARIDRLRAINEAAEKPAEPRTRGLSQTVLQLDERLSIAVPNDAVTDDAPVVVEQRRVRDRNGPSTTHLTVVRQGDKILSIVRPESAHTRGDWDDEEDFIAGAD